MSKNISKSMEKAWDNFKPRPSFDLIKVGDRPSKYVEHKLSGY